jgi:hypothetical protein
MPTPANEKETEPQTVLVGGASIHKKTEEDEHLPKMAILFNVSITMRFSTLSGIK